MNENVTINFSRNKAKSEYDIAAKGSAIQVNSSEKRHLKHRQHWQKKFREQHTSCSRESWRRIGQQREYSQPMQQWFHGFAVWKISFHICKQWTRRMLCKTASGIHLELLMEGERKAPWNHVGFGSAVACPGHSVHRCDRLFSCIFTGISSMKAKSGKNPRLIHKCVEKKWEMTCDIWHLTWQLTCE